MPRRISLFAAVLLLVAALPVQADFAPIELDGDFTDWSTLTADATDTAGDDGSSGIDFGQVWVANDENYLYVRFETGVDVQPDEQQQMILYLDTDLNAGTGQSFGGIGADLVWRFGDRDGTFYRGGSAFIEHADVGLLMGPTVSSTEFEIALRRDAVPANGQDLFPGSQVRFILDDDASGDRVPNAGSVVYTFQSGSAPVPTLDLGRADPSHLRMATWNVQSDGLFDGGDAEAAQNRLLDVMDPDVLVVNEVWSHNATEVRNMIEQHLPSGAGEQWYATGNDGGNVLVSRFPILQSWEVNPGFRITAALLDLGATVTEDLLVIACHWRCCTADDNRQEEADSIIEFLHDARNPGGSINLAASTPFVLMGDLNLVGWRQQLETILTGDVINEGTYGLDSPPDWDGGPFTQVMSRHPDARVAYTWRKDWSTYYPGVLDYILYTDSALQLHNNYVMETRTMTASTRVTYGLLTNDTTDASDHAARVADFTLTSGLSAVPGAGPAAGSWARLLPNTPNPFNPSTALRFALERDAHVDLAVFDVRGRLVRDFASRSYPAGSHAVTWDGRDQQGRGLASGVYQVRMIGRGSDGSVLTTSRPVTLVE
ncbi:MAG: hypothetical protein GY838_14190 [bacterium]|nr:hypothetical protein [bacterium]